MVTEARDPLVITRPFYLESKDCGYCKGKKNGVSPAAQAWPTEAGIPQTPTHVTIGCKVEQMSCRDYDEFMNLGFRRLGDFLYKGDMLRGCCRMYTIRTQLSNMSVSKEHRQVVNRFKRAIADPVETHEPEIMQKLAGLDKKRGYTPAPKFELRSLIRAEQESTRFYTRFEPASYSDEKYALYRKYQIKVHNDAPSDVSKALFSNFLCDTPFLDHEVRGNAKDWQELNTWVKNWSENGELRIKENGRQVSRLGPTHECYYLDGKLIAISVIDFLPTGVSSVYLIWDPDYAHLSLGTLLAVREVQMCHELNLGYYYLGYYLEDCDKMRYKKKFGGEVLDVCNEAYVPLEKVRPMMKDDDFWTITEDGHEDDEEDDSDEDDEDDEDEEDNDEDNEDNEEDKGEDKIKGNDIISCEGNCCDAPVEDSGEGEHELTLSGTPDQWRENLVNVAPEIYGKKETYKVASIAQKILRSQLQYSNSELPAVLPGAIPLSQLVAWIEESALDSDLPATVFSPLTGKLYECNIGELGATERNHVLDFLRLFGLERTQTAIIIA